MAEKMDQKNIIYGKIDCGKVKWDAAGKAIEKHFKAGSGSYQANKLKTYCTNTVKKFSTKKAYFKIGTIGNKLVARVKTEGLLKSTHLADDVIVKDIKTTQKILDAFSTRDTFDKVLKDKSAYDMYKSYANDPKVGAIANEIGFYETAGVKNLNADKRKKIYELFIIGKYEINISNSARKNLKKFVTANNYAEMDFTVARHEIKSMLRRNYPQLLFMLTDKMWNKYWK